MIRQSLALLTSRPQISRFPAVLIPSFYICLIKLDRRRQERGRLIPLHVTGIGVDWNSCRHAFNAANGERECALLDRPHFFFLFFFPTGFSSSALFRLRDAQPRHPEPTCARPFSGVATIVSSCVRSLNRSTSTLERPILTTGLRRFTRKPYLFRIVGVLSRVSCSFSDAALRTHTYVHTCIYIKCVATVFEVFSERKNREWLVDGN